MTTTKTTKTDNNSSDPFADFLGEEPATKKAPAKKPAHVAKTPTVPKNESNKYKAEIKSKLMSIVTSLDVMDEERENIKEIKKDLKDTHAIEPKVAAAVAKILRDPSKLTEMEDTAMAIDQLLSNIK